MYGLVSGRGERRGRQRGLCSQRYHRTDVIEEAVERLYAKVELTPAKQATVRALLHQHLDELNLIGEQEVRRAKAVLTRLEREERKLLQAHYDDRVSEGLFASEQERIARERNAAERTIAELTHEQDIIRDNLDAALALTGDVQAAYIAASRAIRRCYNQAFFVRIEITEDEICDLTLSPPYAQLLAHDLLLTLETETKAPESRQEAEEAVLVPATAGRNDRTPGLSVAGGSIRTKMVERTWRRANHVVPAPSLIAS